MLKLTAVFIIFFFHFSTFSNWQEIVKSSKLNPNDFSLWYADVEDKKVLLDWKSDVLRKPASITKLITAISTFKNLPLDKKFMTSLRHNGNVINSELKGDLCFQGQGDPSFISEQMWKLIEAYSRKGVKTISGNLVVDSSFFDQKLFPKLRQKVRVDRAYDAPISASSFNWNTVTVYISPGQKIGDSVSYFALPESNYFKFVNKAKTINGSKQQLAVKRKKLAKGDEIEISGVLGINYFDKKKNWYDADGKVKIFYKSISQPTLWVGEQLKAFLAEKNITVKGKIEQGQCLKGVNVAQIESKPIEDIVKDMMKYSNNFIAEMLTIHLGLEKYNKAELAAGVEWINNELTSIGWKKNDFVLESPSGLSQKNQIKTKFLGELLVDAAKDYNLFTLLSSSLPLAGVDGTLKSRFSERDKAYKKLRAKTGLLNGVSSLAGYFQSKSGKLRAFVIVYNGKNHFEARNTIDAIVNHWTE